MDGLLIVDKPRGVSSFNVIRDVRKEYGIRAVGHIGTLDPEASGVLPILVGKATKLSDLLMLHDKDYIAEITLGIKTDSGDVEGNIIERDDSNHNSDKNQILTVLNSFKGHSKQIPPMYSAVKVNGKRLYEYARAGEEVERPSRKATIFDFRRISEPVYNEDKKTQSWKFEVSCSKGTYVRTLSVDLGKSLGVKAHMSQLTRVKSGSFHADDCITLEQLNERVLNDNVQEALKPVDIVFDEYPRIILTKDV